MTETQSHEIQFIQISLSLAMLRHDKTNEVAVRPAKTQSSLGIRQVWSESSLCAHWVAKDPRFLHVDSEDWSDKADAQADLSLRWAHNNIVGLSCRGSYLLLNGLQFVPFLKSFTETLWKSHLSRVMRKGTLALCSLRSFKHECAVTQRALCPKFP